MKVYRNRNHIKIPNKENHATIRDCLQILRRQKSAEFNMLTPHVQYKKLFLLAISSVRAYLHKLYMNLFYVDLPLLKVIKTRRQLFKNSKFMIFILKIVRVP